MCGIAATATATTPAFYAWDNDAGGHHSKIWIKTKTAVPKGTTLKIKVLVPTDNSCAITVQTESKKLAFAERVAGFDCSKSNAQVGQELSFTTKTDGFLAIAVGNYGEQITDLVEADGGYEATWKDQPAKSVIKLRVYE